MQRNAEWRAAPDRGQGIGVGDGPGQARSGVGAVTGAGQQRAELLEGEAEGQRRGQRVGRGAERKFAAARVPGRATCARQRARACQQRMMHHRQAQQPGGMTAQGAPVGGDQQQPRGGQRRKQAQDAEIPHLGCVHAHDARGALREGKRQQHAQRGDCAVGRDENCSDVKENGMHLRQDKAAELAG